MRSGIRASEREYTEKEVITASIHGSGTMENTEKKQCASEVKRSEKKELYTTHNSDMSQRQRLSSNPQPTPP